MEKNNITHYQCFWVLIVSGEINIITKKIVDDVLELFSEKVHKIVLYGSYARGDFTQESDVDIMIILWNNRTGGSNPASF